MGGLTIGLLSQQSWNVSEVRPDVKFQASQQTPPLNGPNLMARPSPLQGRGPWVMGLIPLILTLSVRIVELNKNSDYLAKSISYLCTRDTHWLHFSSLSFLLYADTSNRLIKLISYLPRDTPFNFISSVFDIRHSPAGAGEWKTWQHSPTFTKSLSYLCTRDTQRFHFMWISLLPECRLAATFKKTHEHRNWYRFFFEPFLSW